MEGQLSTATWIKSSFSGDNGGNCLEVACLTTEWVKSSYSGDNGGDCLEVACLTTEWAKSSYSAANGGNCLEVARASTCGTTIGVRDSKNPTGPVLHLTPNAFGGLVSYAKNSAV
ncbi:DUF397 domain-containing protein [Streptomyces sp. NPDC003860]